MGRPKKTEELKGEPTELVELPDESELAVSEPEEVQEKPVLAGLTTVTGEYGVTHVGVSVEKAGRVHLECKGTDGTTYLVHENETGQWVI